MVQAASTRQGNIWIHHSTIYPSSQCPRVSGRVETLRGMWTSTHLRLLQALQKTDLPYLSEVPIEAGNGKTYQADILVGSRLVVEIDGPIHTKHLDKDEQRDHELALLGYTTIRFTNRQVKKELDRVVEKITRAYAESWK